MNREMLMLVDAISREKSVERDVVFGAVEAALADAPAWVDVPSGKGHVHCETWPAESLREWHRHESPHKNDPVAGPGDLHESFVRHQFQRASTTNDLHHLDRF